MPRAFDLSSLAGRAGRVKKDASRPSTIVVPPEQVHSTVTLARLQRANGNRFVQRLLAEKVTDEVSDADQTEFNLLKGKITDADAKSYVEHRNEFFGSAEDYQAFATESDKELADNKLEKLVELEGEAQKVFYRWVRKAYHNQGITDVPALIKSGSSKELNEALAKVKKAYAKDFKSGGFNPRPMKSAQYRYRLGTISEHALGKAVDIESGKNPILSASDWAFIETLTGKTVDRSLSRWKKEPEALWKDVKALNDLFVSKVAGEIERIRAEQSAAETAAKAKEPIDVALAGHLGLKKWEQGFFSLEWELVEQLHLNGFTWGVTFGSADLHHFEL